MSLTPEHKIVSIPPTLCNSGVRFLLVREHGKEAVEPGWNDASNYEFGDPKLLSWIKKGGNYGVFCKSPIVVVDIDDPSILPRLESLPQTFTVESGSGGGKEHRYYDIGGDPGDAFVLVDQSQLDDRGNFKHVGDVKGGGKGYVVGPNCIHPSGNPYRLKNDLPLTKITYAELRQILSPFTGKKRKRETSTFHHRQTRVNIPIENEAYPLKAFKRGSDIQGEHPIHGSSTGKNFAINPFTNTWFCYRDQCGGGPLEWLAIKHGLVTCDEYARRGLTKEQYVEVKEIARSQGYNIEYEKRIVTKKPEDIIKAPVTKITELPSELPEERITLLVAPPRLGKTRNAVRIGVNMRGASYVTQNHSIIEQMKRIYREIKRPGQRAVHIVGKARACRGRTNPDGLPECSTVGCPWYPFENEDSKARLHHLVAELFDAAKDGVLDLPFVEDHPLSKDDCPYFILREAERIATHAFAPANLVNDLAQRELVILDEDTTASHFFPSSVALLERTSTGGNRFEVNHLEQDWPEILKIKARVFKGRKVGRKTILRLIDILELTRNIIATTDETARKSNEAIVEELSKLDLSIPEPGDTTFIDLIDSLFREGIGVLTPYLTALAFPYKDKQVFWSPGQTRVLHFVADESKPFRELPLFNVGEDEEGRGGTPNKLFVIGATRAEILLANTPHPVKVLTINTFPLVDWFRYIIPVPDVITKLGEERHKKGFSDKRVILQFMKTLNRSTETKTRIPHLCLTGSGRDARYVKDAVGGLCHEASNEGRIGHLWNHHWGGTTTFYQNSVISRGIDVDFYNTLAVYSVGFSNPYWSAVAEYSWENKLHEQYFRALGISDAILRDETTNSVLRIAPVPDASGVVGGSHLKVVVLPENAFVLLSSYAFKEEHVKRIPVTLFTASKNLWNEILEKVNLHRQNDEKDTKLECEIRPYIGQNSQSVSTLNLISESFKEKIVEIESISISLWPKHFKESDKILMEKQLMAHLKSINDKGWRMSEAAIIKWLSKQKNAFKQPLCKLMIEELVSNGKILREGAGSSSMFSVRVGYVMPDGTLIESAADLARKERKLSEFKGAVNPKSDDEPIRSPDSELAQDRTDDNSDEQFTL